MSVLAHHGHTNLKGKKGWKITQRYRKLMPKAKKILEQLSRTRIFTVFENPTLFSLLRSRGEMAQNSNPLTNRVLESCSYIFYTPARLYPLKPFKTTQSRQIGI